MNIDLSNKVAIVTGGSRGIGAKIAKTLAKAGAKIAIVYKNSQEAAEQVKSEIEKNGGSCLLCQMDLAQHSNSAELFKKVNQYYKQVDILVNNAAIFLEKSICDVTEQDFDEVFATNVKAPFFLAQQALACFPKGGRIINIGSAVMNVFFENFSVYASSKGGIHMITHGLAAEAGKKGITINTVSPGATRTEMLDTVDKSEQEKYAQNVCLKRLGETDDIADVVLFMASEYSRWITGQNIRANGGWS